MVGRTFPGLNEIIPSIRKNFNATISLNYIDFDSKDSFVESKGQYDAALLLDELRRFELPVADKTVFIFREDIFVDKMSFIFGLAENEVCLVSTARLDPRFYGPVDDPKAANALFKERIIKEIIHELGHTFGLMHCKDKKCAMVFSNSIEDVDYKGVEFCKKCTKKLKELEAIG